jgi:hypothetical protein
MSLNKIQNKIPKNNVIKERGIQNQSSLLKRGFKPWVVASILAVIIGAIADSIIATSIISEFCFKITTYNK